MPGMGTCICNPITQEAEVGRSLVFEASLGCILRPYINKQPKNYDLQLEGEKKFFYKHTLG